MLSIGDSKVSKLYIGDTECKKAYLGDTLILDNSINKYTVTVSIFPIGAGTITGDGTYNEGEQVTLVIIPSEGYEFTGWREEGIIVSTSTQYTFTINSDKNFVADFEEELTTPKFVETTMATSRIWRDIKYLNNEFFSVGIYTGSGSSNVNNYTKDGIAWTSGNGPSYSSHGFVYSVAYGANKYVISGTGKMFYSSSKNGNWSYVTSPLSSSYPIDKLAYGNGAFVGTSFTGDKIIYSTSGTSWTSKTVPFSNALGLCFGGDKFVITQNNGNNSAYSLDGKTWISTTLPISGYFQSIAYGNNRFVAVSAGNGSIKGNAVVYSNDGINWESATMPSSLNWYIYYGGGIFLAVSWGNDIFAYSKDGILWETGKMPFSANWFRVAYGNGRFIAVSYDNTNRAAYALY